MPNYRNKNRNRNKNKQRNKQQQQQQQQQQQKNQTENTNTAPTNSEKSPTPTPTPIPPPSPPNVASQTQSNEVTNASAIAVENKNVTEITETAAASVAATIEKVPDVTIVSTTTTIATTISSTNGTVFNEPSVCENISESEINYAVNADDHNMGNEKSKLNDPDKCQDQQMSPEASLTPPTNSPLVGKVIVHRIICEDTTNTTSKTNKETSVNTTANELTTPSKEIVRTEHSQTENKSKVIVHNVLTTESESEESKTQTVAKETRGAAAAPTAVQSPQKVKKQRQDTKQLIKPEEEPFKVLIHKILTTAEEDSSQHTEIQQPDAAQVVIHKIESEKTDTQGQEHKVALQETETQVTASQAVEQQKPSSRVIVHQVVVEDNQSQVAVSPKTEGPENTQKDETNIINSTEPQSPDKVIVHQVAIQQDSQPSDVLKHERKVCSTTETQQQETSPKVIVHKVAIQDNQRKEFESKQEEPTAKVTVHKVNLALEENENDADADDSSSQSDTTETANQHPHQAKVILHQIHVENREDDVMEQQPEITSPIMKENVAERQKFSTSDVRIVEISDGSHSDLEELRSPVVSEAESFIENSDDLQKVAESITEICTTSSSSSGTSQKQSRKQKRMALEHHFMPQIMNPRFLDSISEENSELSDNSDNPLSRSASTDSATNCPSEAKVQKLNAKFPKSSLDFTKPHKQHHTHRKSKAIREEPIAMAVSARLHDAPDAEVDESCTTLRTCMSPEAEAAEVVFINSASSSMSDLHDLELYDNININTSVLSNDLAKDVNKPMTENTCSSLTLTSSPIALANDSYPIERKTQKLSEFGEIEIINNARDVNNGSVVLLDSAPFPIQPQANERKTDSATLIHRTDSRSSKFSTTLSSSSSPSPWPSSLLSSSASLPANEHLVFDQIEEQISSVLSSINEAAATQNTSKTILANTTKTTTTTTTTTSTSNTSSMKIHTNLLNTQNLPVTTTSTSSITTQTTGTATTPTAPKAAVAVAAAAASQLATRTLETSCESFNTDSSLCADNNAKTTRLVYTHNNVQNIQSVQNMNTVRDLITNNNGNNSRNISVGETSVKLNGNHENSETVNGYMHTYSNNTFTPINPPPRGSPPPPPIPPPPQEMLPEYASSATTTTTANTNASLPLLQKNVDNHNFHTQNNSLNSALSQLTSSSPSTMKRQESMESHCSDSTNISQNTAINVTVEQSTSDFVKTSSISDLKSNTTPIPTPIPSTSQSETSVDPKKLRFLCAETVASLPYGGEVLQELASVAQNIGEARAVKAVKSVDNNNMPYPLPQLPHIDDLQLSLKVNQTNTDGVALQSTPQQQKSDQSWLGVPTTNDPTVLVCLSPSQRSYIQQKPEQKPDDLLDAHQKFMERRGYHEYTKEQLEVMEREKLAEQQLLQTAAMMKKLRKSITPPPPQIPPPPVPVKSSETATIAQNLSKRTVNTTATTSHSHTQNSNDDANQNHGKEQTQAFANGENNGDENKHRLLSIIQDTSESNANKQKHSLSTTTLASAPSLASSSLENSSRQTTNSHSAPVATQVVTETSTLSNNTSKSSYQFPQLSQPKTLGSMQSVETTLGQMFPTMGSSNIFDQEHKRFSNIESSHTEPFCSQLISTQPKRYSSVETHYYETQKRSENGQVVQDFTTSKHETKTSGDKPDSVSSFPLNTPKTNSFFRLGKEQQPEPEIRDKPKAQNNSDDQEIMSALKLNKQSPSSLLPSSSLSLSDTQTMSEKTAKTLESETTIKTTTIEEKTENANDERKEEQQYEKESTVKRGTQDSYEEFRQRAKAAANADAASSLSTLNLPAAPQSLTAKVTSNGDIGDVFSSTISSQTSTTQEKKSSTLSYDHEKLFKEFDDLSKQLHKELETSKAEREQREKSASMFDLNRVHMRQKQQIEEYNKSRHEHLKELEQQIERSMRSRSLLFNKTPENATNTDTVDHQSGRTYEIPIQIENGYTTSSKPAGASEEAPPVPAPPKTYNIPIQLENSNGMYVDDSRFRRAESMFNLSDDMQQQRRRTCSNQSQLLKSEDDWYKYASDLGSSENIARPFAKEVEICYQRRPGGIRAPRLTASTNDLSFNNPHSYDQYNAYNVRRHHAPMLNRAPEPPRPKFGSCYSMIERDPNPKYISTTTRRGVSPAPQPSGYFPLDGCHVREEDIRQRRASLPREIHEQQLKYITSKEEELRTEFERLQNERRRLMEEAQKAQAMQMPQTPTSPMTPTRPLRDPFRSTQKLPTLTEDEVFRQQMAEEWLNKVAERENRRLQNIIKISKIHEDETTSKHKANMEQEFLSRVKERRHKLAMPADSDWESGAESQPTKQAQLSEGEDVPPVKIIEGEREANLRRLPRHLREFAKFSNHQKENIEGGHREEHQEEERSEEATDNSMSRAVKKSTVVKTVKTLRAPMLPANGVHGHGHNLYNKPNGYQSEPEPIKDSDYSTIKYRTVNPNRLQSVSSALNVRKSNDTLYGTLPNPVKSGQNSYKNQPGRIEDYVTGHSSVSEKEKKEQLDQAKLSTNYTEGNLSRALAKESGYTSDSNLVFRKKEIAQSSPLSPVEQKLAYKNVQAGGEPPLFGFRKPAPEKSKDYDFPKPQLPPPPKGELLEQIAAVSPNRYYESDVNIHFKTPIRQEFKYPLSEEELAIRQAEQMQKLYREERRRKYLQELQDMNSRRHTDNFTPSQKSPIPLNRYDDFPADLAPKTGINQVKSVARALYNFQAQNSKELSFKKGDIIYIRRAIDKNWFEGEHNAMIGLFPANYVEVINKESTYPVQIQSAAYRKPSEGQARAKYNFQAQSAVELSLNKGELVALTRRVDDNWFEGRIANRKGIFPVSYVEVLTDIGAEDIAARTTTTQNARPTLDALRTNINNEFNTLTRNGNQPPNAILRETRNHKTDILHVDTSSEPLIYRALYKYLPQNSDELELQEGDIVHVLEKCDDGWYVGTSQRSGCFGTFPGNYVERA